MDRRKSDVPPRRPRRKPRHKGGAAVVIVALLGVFLLLGAGGVVGAMLYLKYAPTPEGDGDGKRDGGAATKLTQMGERFQGTWEGESPERPSVKVYFDVTRDRVTLRAINTRVNEWAEPRVYDWRPLRMEGETLIVSREEVVGEKHQLEWTVVFTSADAMSVRSRDSGRLIANFRRTAR